MDRSFCSILPRAARALAVLALLAAPLVAWTPAARAETFNCTPITSLPADINAPGHYCLQSNLTLTAANAHAIRINADGVVLDCNGHTLFSLPTNTASGVHSNFNRDENVIRNCVIDGYYVGIFVQGGADPGAKGNRVEDNTIVRSRVTGILVYGSHNLVARNRITGLTANYGGVAKGIAIGSFDHTDTGNIIRDNVVADFKPVPPPAFSPATVTGIEFSSLRNAVVSGNTVTGLYANTGGTVTGMRAFNTSGTLVADNVVLAPPGPYAAPFDGSQGIGIWLPGTPEEEATNVCRDNVVGHYLTDIAGCVQVHNTGL